MKNAIDVKFLSPHGATQTLMTEGAGVDGAQVCLSHRPALLFARGPVTYPWGWPVHTGARGQCEGLEGEQGGQRAEGQHARELSTRRLRAGARLVSQAQIAMTPGAAGTCLVHHTLLWAFNVHDLG